MTEIPFAIRPVRTAGELQDAARLFRAYAASLDVDLAYQDFASELASLPGKYAPPEGALLLALDASGRAVGCAALRPLAEAGICEMKRLYVFPEGCGRGLGKALIVALTTAAAAAGYREMWLDTLPSMHEAQALYRAMGFAVVPPYYGTPITGTLFMARTLTAPPCAEAGAATQSRIQALV